ncbi:MAG: Protein-L-isoaspartate O-methyltransferase [Candidatus Omnitrophica bacterium ADurb.Bin277]|nr:MAG: Protein-L-isoaspartate O-methyltransferase [Candidatus Omnitrophica bacterium ADurb.Bin277]
MADMAEGFVRGHGNDPRQTEALAMMVGAQIEPRGIRDERVLQAMRKVPRRLFVPEDLWDAAYEDRPLEIGAGQTISQPYIVAYMTECLGVESSDSVLEIGTGSGYQTAILAELASQVYTVEIIENLARTAKERLEDLGYNNIRFRVDNGRKGWPDEAPFDKIIVTAASDEIPPGLIEQLREGGRMILPVGVASQELIEGEKQHGTFQTHRKIAVRFVPLV